MVGKYFSSAGAEHYVLSGAAPMPNFTMVSREGPIIRITNISGMSLGDLWGRRNRSWKVMTPTLQLLGDLIRDLKCYPSPILSIDNYVTMLDDNPGVETTREKLIRALEYDYEKQRDRIYARPAGRVYGWADSTGRMSSNSIHTHAIIVAKPSTKKLKLKGKKKRKTKLEVILSKRLTNK